MLLGKRLIGGFIIFYMIPPWVNVYPYKIGHAYFWVIPNVDIHLISYLRYVTIQMSSLKKLNLILQ